MDSRNIKAVADASLPLDPKDDEFEYTIRRQSDGMLLRDSDLDGPAWTSDPEDYTLWLPLDVLYDSVEASEYLYPSLDGAQWETADGYEVVRRKADDESRFDDPNYEGEW